MKIGVLTAGGDSPGMNAAIRAVARQTISLGGSVVGFRYGFDGVFQRDMVGLLARTVGGIMDQGGTFLGTGRCPLMMTEEGQKEAAGVLRAEGFDGLVVIGGDGSMSGSLALCRQGVPVVGLPGTIDNDVWGSEESIGFDTCLNTILDAVSRIRDTASAHDRVFVVEVMGRDSGELAVKSAIAGGADFVLVPEAAAQRAQAIDAVRYDHERGKLHTIIIVAEGCCRAAEVVAELQPHAVGHDVRMSVLGYIQRGGHPSARDRILGSRLGAAAVQALFDGRSAIMVGMRGGLVAHADLETVVSRRKELDMDLLRLVNTLAI